MIDDELRVLIEELRELAEKLPHNHKWALVCHEAADRLRQMAAELELAGQEP